LLQSGQNQSQASERTSLAISEINAAIKRIASAAQSLNELGITASSAALELTASIEEVTRNALQVGVFAKDTRASMESMVQGMKVMEEASEKLMAASGDTDASMQNMHRRIEEVTRGALESDELSERASSAAQTGAKVVQDVEAGMGHISEAFENVSRVIGHLAQRSEQIGQILNVITQVSDQTNLLSLNAAILSAQAGVHGKGFAVVADEIRKLSNRTAASVQEIEQLISSVRVEISETVNSMEAGKTRLAEGFERSRRASEALSEILTSTAATRQRVAAITQSTNEQTQAEREVQQATATINSRLDQITKIIKDQTRASKEVYAKAERMIELLRNVEKGMEEQTHGAKEVSGIVEHLSGIIQNIHLATAEQSTRSSQVVHSVDSLRSAVQSGIAAISALNSTAISLGQESFIFNHELSHFRLPQPKPGGTLMLGIAAKVSSLDPAYSDYVFIYEWVYNFYEGLVEFGEGTDIRPCLAERWEVSEDGLVYTFHLKRTATDVKASFERVLHPITRSAGTWVFEMVTGAEDYIKGNQRSVEGICAVDPYTLRVRLRKPVPFFLGMMAQPYAYVLPSTFAAAHAPLVEICGTGPFRLDRFVPDHSIEMSRFEGYHGAPLPYLDRVTAEFGLRESEIAEGMRTGKYHFTTELQKHYLEKFLTLPEWRPRLQTNVQLYTSLLALSCKIPPLDDVRVRQAIAFAVDRDRIVKDVVGTVQAIVARTLLPPGLPGHDSSAIVYTYDPERARSLLRQAGVPQGTRLETWHAEAASNLDVLKIIQENLKDVGLDLQIREVDPDTHRKAIDQGAVPMRMTRWIADYPDPDNFLYVTFHSKSPVYNLGFQDVEFDRLVEEARSLPDIQERIRLYQKAERIWLQNCPCICLYHNQALVLHQDSLQGCVPHFTNPVVRLKKIWLS
jgi:ABC-type transport system substrate-binding protein